MTALTETLASMLDGGAGLAALCLSAFLSATVLPGSSEALLAAAVAAAPETGRTVLLAAAASVFNTLGSMTSWCIGRCFRQRAVEPEALARVQRWGAPALFFAWVPVVGDMLPIAAGWLRIGFWPALLWTALGKSFRYAVLAWAALQAARALA